MTTRHVPDWMRDIRDRVVADSEYEIVIGVKGGLIIKHNR